MKKKAYAVVLLLILGGIIMYERVNWQNSPSTATPVSADNLNKMDMGIADIDSQLADISKQGVSLLEFGAISDYNILNKTGTDNTQAFIDAITYASNNDIPLIIPSGNYGINNIYYEIPLGKSLKMKFNENATLYKLASDGTNAFELTVDDITSNVPYVFNVVIDNINIQGNGIAGSKGLVLHRLVNTSIIRPKINRFDVGIETEFCFVGEWSGLDLWRNTYGLILGKSSNALNINNLDGTMCTKSGLVINGGKNITFNTPILQGSKYGCVITGKHKTGGITFNNPYFESNTDVLIAVGYNEQDLSVNETAQNVFGVNILGSITNEGAVPLNKCFMLRKMSNFFVEHIGYNSGITSAFKIADEVYNVRVGTTEGAGTNLLSESDAIKNKYTYQRSRNLISNGELNGNQYSFSSGGLSYSKNGNRIDFTIPNDGVLKQIIFRLKNPNKYNSLCVNASTIFNSNLATCQIAFYDGDGASLGVSNVDTLGKLSLALRSIPTTNEITVRILLKNTSGNTQTFSLNHIFLTEEDDISVVPSAYDIMLQNSGTLSFTDAELTKTVDCEFETYYSKIFITKSFDGDVKVTKNVGDGYSFTVDVMFAEGVTSGNVDYFIIPYHQY